MPLAIVCVVMAGLVAIDSEGDLSPLTVHFWVFVAYLAIGYVKFTDFLERRELL